MQSLSCLLMLVSWSLDFWSSGWKGRGSCLFGPFCFWLSSVVVLFPPPLLPFLRVSSHRLFLVQYLSPPLDCRSFVFIRCCVLSV